MQLVITELSTGVWVQLEGETSAEMQALEDCGAGGRTERAARLHSGEERLLALATRLGFPAVVVRG